MNSYVESIVRYGTKHVEPGDDIHLNETGDGIDVVTTSQGGACIDINRNLLYPQ